MFTPARVDRAELLDLGAGSDDETAASLADLRRINRYLGGRATLLRHLGPRLAALGRPAVVLDLGTGSADLPVAIARWCRAHGLPVRIVALELVERHLAAARRQVADYPEISLVRSDVFRLPGRRPAADFVVCSLLLHHFAPEQAAALLAAGYACARQALIVNDLDRSWLPWLGVKLLQPVFARSRLTQFDAGVSVLRAYTRTELEALSRLAGLPRARVSWHWPWRLALVAERPGAQ
jgi:SAM-dependent methyltransferase